jgi:c-di-GMP-binding flagellar brake protein YcgR
MKEQPEHIGMEVWVPRGEHRRHRRYEVNDVEGTFLFDMDLNVLNLSLAGMAVETPHQLSVGRRYAFNIQHENQVVKLHGTVAWSTLRSTRRVSEEEIRPVYHAGIHFEDVLTDSAQDLKHLIDENVVLDVHRRLFGRFHLAAGTTVASVNSDIEFEVRKISLSGMLAVSTLCSELGYQLPLQINLANGMFTANGRVAFAKPDDDKESELHRYQLGIEFLSVAEEDHRKLAEFIELGIAADQPAE